MLLRIGVSPQGWLWLVSSPSQREQRSQPLFSTHYLYIPCCLWPLQLDRLWALGSGARRCCGGGAVLCRSCTIFCLFDHDKRVGQGHFEIGTSDS